MAALVNQVSQIISAYKPAGSTPPRTGTTTTTTTTSTAPTSTTPAAPFYAQYGEYCLSL